MDDKLLKEIKSFYTGSKACVRINGKTSEWFEVKGGLKQGCVMSTWLFNIYMDGVMKEVIETIGNVGVEMKMGKEKWKLSHLLYADDAVLLTESREELQEYVKAFVNVCKKRNLKMNVNKSKVMVFERNGTSDAEIIIEGETMEVVDKFLYLGSVRIRKEM